MIQQWFDRASGLFRNRPGVRDLGGRVMNRTHRAVQALTGGRVGWRAFGMPVVELTTIGRKSGQPRKTMLTTPVHDERRVVLVASYGGDDRHPAWFLNLRDHPDVEITMDGERRPMRARVATGEERADLWPRIVETYKGYGEYQTRTEREIPVVLLEPRDQ